MEKDVYILDEPTSNLDKHTEEIVVDFILKHFTSLISPDIADYCIILSPLVICLLFLLTLPDSGRLTLE